MTRIIPPGATIGVLGSGQLGRMFAIAARRLGYCIHVLSPEANTPAGQIADLEIQARFDDLDAIDRFARQVDVVTFEFENVPVEAIDVIERFTPVHPAGRVLDTTQRRDREKTFLKNAGISVASFQLIRNLADLKAASHEGFPGILKTAAWGYDGKGQARINSRREAESVWLALDTESAVLEQLVDFELEFSVVAARGASGEFAHYDPIVNRHQDHILSISVSPGDLPPMIVGEAAEITRTIMEKLEVVGVLCVEFFLTKEGRLLVNELAPRPHNSGHLTIDAHTTCQFEQQVRAICGLPLGSTTQLRPAAMANLLGDLWADGEPPWTSAYSLRNVKVHLYGKRGASAGRKMGHLTAHAETAYAAEELVKKARALLTNGRNVGSLSPA